MVGDSRINSYSYSLGSGNLCISFVYAHILEGSGKRVVFHVQYLFQVWEGWLSKLYLITSPTQGKRRMQCTN